MGKSYLGICSSEYLFNHAHTVKTFNNEIYVNLWNGYYVCRSSLTKMKPVQQLHAITKNVEKDRIIVASRTRPEFPLLFLAEPNQIKRKLG